MLILFLPAFCFEIPSLADPLQADLNEQQLSKEETFKLLEEAGNQNLDDYEGLKQSLSKFWKAARGQGPGASAAIYELGKIFEEGRIGDVDHQAPLLYWKNSKEFNKNLTYALNLYNKSASLGNPQAQFSMGVYYATSSTLLPGTHQSLPKTDSTASSTSWNETFEALAIVNYYFSALGGNGLASMALGFRHHQGYSVPKNCDAALLYYEMAANIAFTELLTQGYVEGQDRSRLSAFASRPNPKGLGIGVLQTTFDTEMIQYHEWMAAQGSINSMLALGDMNYHGTQVVRQNPSVAAKWYLMAAKAGEPSAAGIIGHMYLKGVGVHQSNTSAFKYFKLGADAGDASSLNGLGMLHQKGSTDQHGMPIEPNLAAAAHHFRRATEKGDMDAMYNLAMLHLTAPSSDQPQAPQPVSGSSSASEVAQDHKKKAPGHKHTKHGGAKAEIRKKFRSEETAEVEVSADGSTSKGVSAGQSSEGGSSRKKKADIEKDTAALSQKPAGQGKNQPKGADQALPQKDIAKALQLLTIASHNGHLKALHKTAQLYAEGIGVPRSCPMAVQNFKNVAERVLTNRLLSRASRAFSSGFFLRALSLYLRAAEAGSELAQSNAAWMLDSGYAPSDYCGLDSHPCEKEALRLYQNAARQGRSEAALKVGDFHYYGRGGLPVNKAAAVQYYQRAVEQHNPQAMFNLGYMYQFGEGVTRRDFHLAKRYYDMAISTHPEAQIPAKMGLFVMWFHMLVSEFTSGLDPSEETDLKTMLAIPATALLEIMAVDTLLIIALLSLLIYVLKHRWNRLPFGRREQPPVEPSEAADHSSPPTNGQAVPQEMEATGSAQSQPETLSEAHSSAPTNGQAVPQALEGMGSELPSPGMPAGDAYVNQNKESEHVPRSETSGPDDSSAQTNAQAATLDLNRIQNVQPEPKTRDSAFVHQQDPQTELAGPQAHCLAPTNEQAVLKKLEGIENVHSRPETQIEACVHQNDESKHLCQQPGAIEPINPKDTFGPCIIDKELDSEAMSELLSEETSNQRAHPSVPSETSSDNNDAHENRLEGETLATQQTS